MSIKVMTHVWSTSQYGGSDLLLLLALADTAHDDGYGWLSVPALAKKSRMSERSVQRALRAMETNPRQEIEILRNKGPHGCHAFQFLNLPAGVTDRRGDRMTPVTECRGVNLSGCQSVGVTSEAAGVTDLSPIPSLERSLEDPPLESPQGDINASVSNDVLMPVKKRKVSTKTHVVPADFVVTPAMRVWAAEMVPGVDLERETEKFRNHEFYRAHQMWEQTWRNWMMKAWEQMQEQRHVTPISRAQQRNQNNIASTLRLEELLNGRNGSQDVREPAESTGSSLSHRIAGGSPTRLLDRSGGPAS